MIITRIATGIANSLLTPISRTYFDSPRLVDLRRKSIGSDAGGFLVEQALNLKTLESSRSISKGTLCTPETLNPEAVFPEGVAEGSHFSEVGFQGLGSLRGIVKRCPQSVRKRFESVPKFESVRKYLRWRELSRSCGSPAFWACFWFLHALKSAGSHDVEAPQVVGRFTAQKCRR